MEAAAEAGQRQERGRDRRVAETRRIFAAANGNSITAACVSVSAAAAVGCWLPWI